MAFTVEPASVENIEIIDTSEKNKDLEHYNIKYEEKFETDDHVEKIIVFDPRRDKTLQINANGQAYDIDVTSYPGVGITNITDSNVPWVSLEAARTTDFLSGGSDINRGILAVRITSNATLTDDFEIGAQQYGDNE